MHYLNNAHNQIVFMDETHRIFGSSPTEPLHCVRKGEIEICCKLIMNEGMSKHAQVELDAVCGLFHCHN